MLTRRSILKGVLGGLSAAVGAVTLDKGADAREPAPVAVGHVEAISNADGYFLPAMPHNPATMVTLERSWRIVNDPSYVNFGKYADASGSVFPEYDDRLRIVRHATTDGWSAYSVCDTTTGRGAVYPDPSLKYADASISSQEVASRAPYATHVAMLR